MSCGHVIHQICTHIYQLIGQHILESVEI